MLRTWWIGSTSSPSSSIERAAQTVDATRMLKTQRLTKEFLEAVGQDLPHEDGPGIDRLNYQLLRELVREEAREFDTAMLRLHAHVSTGGIMGTVGMHLWAEVIDAMCDLIVTVHNTSNAMGIDLEPFFDEVHRSNMDKVGGPVRADGKQLKPADWQPPRIRKILENAVFGEPTGSSS